MSNKQHSEQHNTLLKKKNLEQKEVQEIKVIIKKYLIPGIAAVAVVSICFMAVGITKSFKQKKLDKACTALQDANIQAGANPKLAIDSYLALADEYKSSPYAPIALMSAARIKFNQGDYVGAEALFSQVTEQHSDHDLTLTAEFNEIVCREERGLTEAAEKQYADFADKNNESYLSSAARMAQARCLKVLGKQKEALQIYEELSTLNSPWKPFALEKQTLLSKKLAL